ncbi:hypothetical protein ABIE27_003056 [Paenibacillus sp. 4624]|uniref:hypothetical protein n=1 Tax=Paenibacillus sp. 4624 TaxID=3156453 RepID=UPI003D223C80
MIISKFNVIFVDITFFPFYNLNQNHSDVIISEAGAQRRVPPVGNGAANRSSSGRLAAFFCLNEALET